MKDYGPWAKICRRLMQIFGGRYQVVLPAQLPQPALYLCRHLNMKGPIVSLAWLPFPVRPWIFALLCDRQTCYQHYYNYTFTQRFGWPLFLAKAIARPLSAFMAAMTRDLQAIPVHRDKQSFQTISQSRRALLQGDSLILYPDIEYTSTGEMGALYQGFLLLEKFYYPQSRCHLPIIPIRLKNRQLIIGDAIYFGDWQDDDQFSKESAAVLNKIMKNL